MGLEAEYLRFDKALLASDDLCGYSTAEGIGREFNAPVDYPRLRMMFKCDFLALTYLLKNAVNVHQRYSGEERLLMFYFRLVFASLTARHWLRVGEKPAILKLTSILQYFANVVGQRVNTVRFANLTAADYVPAL